VRTESFFGRRIGGATEGGAVKTVLLKKNPSPVAVDFVET
jgi:hypothetical protein